MPSIGAMTPAETNKESIEFKEFKQFNQSYYDQVKSTDQSMLMDGPEITHTMEDTNSFLQHRATLTPNYGESLIVASGHETSHTADFPRRGSFFGQKRRTTLENKDNEWQLPELTSPNKSVFVKDYMKKVKYKRGKHSKRFQHERNLTM